MSRTVLQSYGTQQVMTSSPSKLIALLYDKAIVSLKEAVQAIEDGQIERRWKANTKAIEIITHLANTLDHEGGGEIASNLDRLYEFMLQRLLNVDLKNDAQAATEVIKLLQPLRDSWHQLAHEPAAQEARAGASAPAAGATAGPAADRGPTAASPGENAGSGGKAQGKGDIVKQQPINLSA